MFLLKKLIKLLSWNDDERMQSNDSIKAYANGMSKDLVNEKEEIRCHNKMKQYNND